MRMERVKSEIPLKVGDHIFEQPLSSLDDGHISDLLSLRYRHKFRCSIHDQTHKQSNAVVNIDGGIEGIIKQ